MGIDFFIFTYKKSVKNPWRSHPLKGFFRGLGVVKGEGVATAKKALPFPLKKRKEKI